MERRLGGLTLFLLACLAAVKAQDDALGVQIPREIGGIWAGFLEPTPPLLEEGYDPMCLLLVVRAPRFSSALGGVLLDGGSESCLGANQLDFDAATYSRQTHFFNEYTSIECEDGEIVLEEKHLVGPEVEQGQTAAECGRVVRADDEDGPRILFTFGFQNVANGSTVPEVVCPNSIDDRSDSRVSAIGEFRAVNPDDIEMDPKAFTCK